MHQDFRRGKGRALKESQASGVVFCPEHSISCVLVTNAIANIWVPWVNIWVPVTILTVQACETGLLTFLPSLAPVVSVLGDREASRRL